MNDNLIKKVKDIFDATLNVIKPMKDGDREKVEEITKAVAISLYNDPDQAKKISLYVSSFLHEEKELGYVSRGKHGGYIRGKKKTKVVKAAPSSTDMMDDSDNDDLKV